MTLRRLVLNLFGLALIVSACGGEDEVSPIVAEAEAEIVELLEQEDGREQLAFNLSVGSPLTFDQAVCFVDNSTPRDMAGVLALGAGEAGTDISAVLEPVRQAFVACDVVLETFGLE